MSTKKKLTRPCGACGRDFYHANPNYKTCGSPKCKRVYHAKVEARRTREKRARQKERNEAKNLQRRRDATHGAIRDEMGRREIIAAMEAAVAGGVAETQAIHHVALTTKEKPAVVVAVWRSR